MAFIRPVDAYRAATAPGLVHDGNTPRAMLVEFTVRFLDGLVRVTTSRRRTHDFRDAYLRSATVFRRHAATYVAFGDDADYFEVFLVFNYRRATAP
jgi:hypothetical protein